jgi:hypothetical protein
MPKRATDQAKQPGSPADDPTDYRDEFEQGLERGEDELPANVEDDEAEDAHNPGHLLLLSFLINPQHRQKEESVVSWFPLRKLLKTAWSFAQVTAVLLYHGQIGAYGIEFCAVAQRRTMYSTTCSMLSSSALMNHKFPNEFGLGACAWQSRHSSLKHTEFGARRMRIVLRKTIVLTGQMPQPKTSCSANSYPPDKKECNSRRLSSLH